MAMLNTQSTTTPGFGYSTGVNYDSALQTLPLEYQNQAKLLSQQLQGQLAQRQLDAATANHAADVGAGASQYGSALQAQTTARGQDVTREGNQLAADTTRQGNELQAQTAQRGQDLQLQASLAPLQFKEQQWGQLFPTIQGILGNSSSPTGLVGGQAGAQPQITTGGIWSQNQIDQNVNASNAQAAQQAATQQRDVANQMAGRGYGRSSPLLAALQTAIQGQSNAQAADQERQIRSDAAQKNATQNLASQQAAEAQWMDYQNQDIARRQALTNQTSALLAALGSFF